LLLMIGTPPRQRPIREATSNLIANLYQRSPKFAKVVTATVLADATLKDGLLQVTSFEEFGENRLRVCPTSVSGLG
jgi:hypothetical protein